MAKSASTDALTSAAVVLRCTAIALIERPSAICWRRSSSAAVSDRVGTSRVGQSLDDLRVEHGATGGDLTDCPRQLIALADPVLEEVGVAGGTL